MIASGTEKRHGVVCMLKRMLKPRTTIAPEDTRRNAHPRRTSSDIAASDLEAELLEGWITGYGWGDAQAALEREQALERERVSRAGVTLYDAPVPYNDYDDDAQILDRADSVKGLGSTVAALDDGATTPPSSPEVDTGMLRPHGEVYGDVDFTAYESEEWRQASSAVDDTTAQQQAAPADVDFPAYEPEESRSDAASSSASTTIQQQAAPGAARPLKRGRSSTKRKAPHNSAPQWDFKPMAEAEIPPSPGPPPTSPLPPIPSSREHPFFRGGSVANKRSSLNPQAPAFVPKCSY